MALNLSLRPKSFDEVIGNASQVAAIRKEILSGRHQVGWILTGGFGNGKTTLAYLISREVQGFEFPEDLEPDVREVNAANYRKIEDMRQLVKTSEYLPTVGRYRVIILDECHQLTKESQNILLKELEKPNSPTVWILCTTDKLKIIKGVVDRCYPVPLSGMGPAERHQLLVRAAKAVGRTESVDELRTVLNGIEDALSKAGITSPRAILKAFEAHSNGISAVDAVAALSLEGLPEYKDIAFAVVYRPWAEALALIKKLDEKLKKKKTEKEVADSSVTPDGFDAGKEYNATFKTPQANTFPATDALPQVEAEDLESREEVVRGIRSLVAAFLKGAVYKGGDQADRASESLFILAHCISPNDYDAGLAFAATVGGLYRINQKMKTGR